jgi:cell filamentation protein
MTMNDPYNSLDGVLRNRLGITDSSELEAAEADITAARENALRRRRVHREYDLAHLQAFHRFIFGDIYDWAGELRTVDIAKYDAFCRSVHMRATPMRSSAS